MKKLLVFLSFLLTTSLFAGQVFYVVEGGAGNKDGTSWANAYSDVQTAIDRAFEVATADNPSEVWIAKGTYKHGTYMTMKNNVTIYGGFAGTETSKDQRVAGQNRTYLDGEGKYRVFYNSRVNDTSKLDNVTIQHGYANDGDNRITNEDAGGGMFNDDYSTPIITNCIFVNNTASRGAGVYNNYSTSKMINCSIINNFGYGVANNHSSGLFINCTFSNNTGYAMDNYDSSPNLIHCTLFNNSGGTLNDSSSPQFTNCILWDNVNSNNPEIVNNYSHPVIDSCIIKNGKSCILDNYPSKSKYINEPITNDPNLMPLGNYGGFVPTCPVKEGSSAINAGRVVDGITTDARGFTRSTTAPTIGAYEYIPLPIIKEQPNNVEIYIGNSTTLSVSAIGYDLKYQWQKLVNGKWIDIVGATASTLDMSGLKLTDSSEYRCVVSNGGGSVASNSTKLTVLKTSKIKITQQPVAQATAVGKGTELSVSASGGGIYYQWQVKNGKVWEDEIGETSSTLVFENLKAEDNNKEYRCILKNDISTATSKTAKLVVISTPLPVIDTKKHVPEVAIIEGKKNKATFAIKATKQKGETGTYKYQWYKNGEPIAKATKATYTTDVLTEADFEQDPKDNIYYSKDVYYCVISVDVKKQIITSKPTENFQVMKLEPAKILENPEDMLVSDKEDAIFTAEATKTSGVKAVYQWQVCAFGSDPDNPKNWKNAGKGATLTLKKATVKLSGNLYRCQVYNDLNKKDPDTSAYAKLEVKGTPVIKTQPKAITVYEGKGSSMSVLAQGYNLTYQWYVSDTGKKDSWTILSGETSSTLSIKGDSTKFYQCEVRSNGSAILSKSAKATVKAKVHIHDVVVSQYETELTQTASGYTTFESFPLTMSIIATGDKPMYQWYSSDDGKKFTAITGATKSTLTVDPVFMQDKIYYCKVYNGTSKLGYADGSSAQTDDIHINVKQSYLPEMLDCKGLSGTLSDNSDVFMVFTDVCNFKMNISKGLDPRGTPYQKTSYSYERISPLEANMTIRFMDTYNGRDTLMTYTGLLYYDSKSRCVVADLVDSAKGKSFSFEVDEFISSDHLWQNIPKNSEIVFNLGFGIKYSINIQSPTECKFTYDGKVYQLPYKYMKKKGELGILTMDYGGSQMEFYMLFTKSNGGTCLVYRVDSGVPTMSVDSQFTINK